MSESADFIIEISDPQDRGFSKAKSKLIRFTLTWVLDHPRYGKLGDSQEGCITYYTTGGKLKWSPHKVRVGPKTQKQLHWITPALYNLVLNLIEKEWGSYMRTEAFEFTKPVHTDLPADLKRTVRLEEQDGESVVRSEARLDSDV